jgi:hypothetical protein
LKSGEPLVADLIKHLDTFQASTSDYDVCDETAVETLNKLVEQDNSHVHILTAYPVQYGANRLANLEKHGFKYHEITMGNGSLDKYDVILDCVEKHNTLRSSHSNHRIVVIDDNPKLAKRLLDSGLLREGVVELWVPLQWRYTNEIKEYDGAEHIDFYDNLSELLN